MPAFTTSFLFPDINVWIALTYARHVHHFVARDWLNSLEPDVRFCYLAAFAEMSQITLVTFDRALRGKARPMILLGE